MSTTPLQGTKREGTMVRVARWLVDEVGVDGVFTKQDLIEAFPGISQVDRRMRDLRPHGWVIHTYREDASLAAHEHRFIARGTDVSLKKSLAVVPNITAKERRRILLAADYMCGLCGIPAGQPLPPQLHQSAVLSVSQDSGQCYVRCQMCRSNPAEDAIAALRERFAKSLVSLNHDERRAIQSWLENGRKPLEVERAWSLALRLGRDEARSIEQSSDYSI